MQQPHFIIKKEKERIKGNDTSHHIADANNHLYWKVFTFTHYKDMVQYATYVHTYPYTKPPLAIAAHTQYPYLVLCMQNIKYPVNLSSDQIVELSKMASDWYAPHYLQWLNENIQPPTETDYSQYAIGFNQIEPGNENTEIIYKNTPPRLFIKYTIPNAFFQNFTHFKQSIKTINWIDPAPTEQEQQQILINCYHFAIQEEMANEQQDLEIQQEEENELY